MSEGDKEGVRVTKERNGGQQLNVLTWFEDFLRTSRPDLPAHDIIASLPITNATTKIIQAWKTELETSQRRERRREAEKEKEAEELEAECERWERAGVESLLSGLDEEAANEIEILVEACVALDLSPSTAVDPALRTDATIELADRISAAEMRYASREKALSDAQSALTEAATLLKDGHQMKLSVDADVDRRSSEAKEKEVAIEIMNTKADQYETAAAEMKEIVRNTGITSETTHDAIAEKGEQLREKQAEIDYLDNQLQNYQDLPPDVTAVQALTEDILRRTAKVEEEIQQALNSMA